MKKTKTLFWAIEGERIVKDKDYFDPIFVEPFRTRKEAREGIVMCKTKGFYSDYVLKPKKITISWEE